MKDKNNKKVIVIISIILVILIILLIVTFSLIKSQNEKQKLIDQVKEYTSINDFKSLEEVATYLECDFKKQESSKDENYDIDIYMQIKLLPYTNNQSNKGFYDKLILYSANVLKYQNFRIIDLKNKITIEVFCDKENQKVKNMAINGETNYFAKHDSLLEINNIDNLDVTNIDIQSDIIKKLINNNWQITTSDIGTKESSFEKYDIYFDEGIEIKEVANKVFNIIFTEKYKGNIVNNIGTTSSKEEIIKALGEPTYTDEQTKCIGYKGKDIYVFYNSRKEISVYRVENEFNSSEFAKFVDKYIDNKDETELIQNVKEKYKDYDKYENNSNGIVLQYSLKGITIRFKRGLARGIQIYNNYTGTIYKDINLEKIKENTELPDNIYIKNENLVAKCEIDRISNVNNMIFSANVEQSNNKEIAQSNKFYTIKSQIEGEGYKIKFISSDGNYPNTELRENIEYYIWKDDYNFIYSIKNKGIYLYNLAYRKYIKLVEGTDEEFKIKEYKDNVLIYDEKSIKLK